jgi:hypothetical protein
MRGVADPRLSSVPSMGVLMRFPQGDLREADEPDTLTLREDAPVRRVQIACPEGGAKFARRRRVVEVRGVLSHNSLR